MRENGHVREDVTNGGRSCQRVSGGQFNGGIIVMLWRWPV